MSLGSFTLFSETSVETFVALFQTPYIPEDIIPMWPEST